MASARASIGLDNVVITHVVIVGVPTIFYYYLRLSGASLFELHAAVATVLSARIPTRQPRDSHRIGDDEAEIDQHPDAHEEQAVEEVAEGEDQQ